MLDYVVTSLMILEMPPTHTHIIHDIFDMTDSLSQLMNGFTQVLNNSLKFASETLLEDSMCFLGFLGSSNAIQFFTERIQVLY